MAASAAVMIAPVLPTPVVAEPCLAFSGIDVLPVAALPMPALDPVWVAYHKWLKEEMNRLTGIAHLG